MGGSKPVGNTEETAAELAILAGESGDQNAFGNGNDIFMSIVSKMGCWIRITVTNLESAKDNLRN